MIAFITNLFMDILFYLLSPRAAFAHLIAIGLLFDIYKLNGLRASVAIGLFEEAVIFILWLFIPNSWATILALVICVFIYEQVIGPRVDINEDAILYSDDDIEELLEPLNLSVFPLQAGYGIQTNLRYAAYNPRSWRKDHSKEKLAIDLGSITSVADSCDGNIIGAIRAEAPTETCFHVAIGSKGDTVTFIASSVEEKKQWVSLCQSLLSRLKQDFDTVWRDSLYSKADLTDEAAVIQLDDAVSLLVEAKRSIDKVYAKDMFNSISKQSGMKSSSHPALNGEMFLKFLSQASTRPDIIAVWNTLLDSDKTETFLRAAQFHEFLTSEQKENVTLQAAKLWIRAAEPILPGYNLSPMGFINFITDDQQWLLRRECRTIYQDMHQPLSHYFIATSHNTYLTKDQLKSKSSVDMYIQAFKRGCKCVELDCWDGPNNEPIIYHGHTLTSKIKFVDVVKAINEHAFTVSDYPVILSFENHCSVPQQVVMAKHLVEILGDKLYTNEIEEDEKVLPSPEALKGYVIVKNKKLKEGVDETLEDDDDFSDDELNDELLKEILEKKEKEKNGEDDENGHDNEDTISESGSETSRKSKGFMSKFGDIKLPKRSSSKKKAAKIAVELSNLIAYCRAVPFKGFEFAKENYEHFEMSSFAEKKAFKFAKEIPQSFLTYTTKHMARSYPAGNRVDSSNYDPTTLWNAGVQLVALNYQTGSLPMQLNQGLFRDNGGCGYVLKPQFMRKIDDEDKFDPRGPFEKSKAKKLVIKILSGHQLPYKKDDVKKDRELSIHVRVAGVEADVQRDKTKTVKNNGYSPSWQEEVSLHITVPELALVQLAVMESNSTLLGQYTIPYRCLSQGYRYVPLYNKSSEVIPYASLLIHVSAEGV